MASRAAHLLSYVNDFCLMQLAPLVLIYARRSPIKNQSPIEKKEHHHSLVYRQLTIKSKLYYIDLAIDAKKFAVTSVLQCTPFEVNDTYILALVASEKLA